MRLATPAALATMMGVLLATCSMANPDAPATLRPIKVGTTISLLDFRAGQKSLAKRPIALELAKANLELCCYPGPDKDALAASLKQFNAVWLLLEHEGMNSYDSDAVGKALRDYVEQGGGLVINHSPGRYPEAPADIYWDKVFKYLDMDRLHEEVVDLASREPLEKGPRSAFYTKAFVDHPLTQGVPGLWLLCRDSSAGCGSHAIKYSDDWKIVVSGPNTAKSYLKYKNTNQIDYNKPGFYQQDAPLVAIRQLGKGRIVSIAAHKDHSGWMWGCDRWPSELYRGELHGKPTDMLKLLENALRWAGEPSLDIPEFTKNYHPYEPSVPPYQSNDASGGKAVPRFDKIGGSPRQAGANGIIGLHSSYSDGRSSVAEYAVAAKKAGLNFVVFTDPLELLTPEKIDRLRADCSAVSDDQFYACPGVEHSDASGLRWALFHDRIAFPAKETVFDGVNKFQVFDGKVVLQRNGYDGHQNLYRGAIIDYSALDKAGADAVNLVYFNGVIPIAFEVDKPIADNRQAMLRTAANLHRYAPFSFTRVRGAEEIIRAAKASRTQAATLADIRKTCNASGWGANDAANRGSQRVVLGNGIELERFSCQAVQGLPLFQFAFAVSSPAGIKEVVIHDADQRVLRRFAGNGEKRLEQEFVVPFDRQSYPQLVATDLASNEVISANLWLYQYHAGIFRCGDNSNLLSQNPAIIYFPNWDCSLVPCVKHLATPSPGLSQGEDSEGSALSYTTPSKLPWQRVLDLLLGEKGQSLKAGTKLKYRFAVGSFIKDPQHGDYLKRFASLVNDGDYPVIMKQGAIIDRIGFLTLKAEQGAARLTLGPKPFIQDLPIRVAGLADNGTAMGYSSLDKRFKPLGFNGGLAYAAAPMERSSEVWLGNVFIASDPAVRMTLVPKMAGLPEGFLEVHNPTDQALKVKVMSPAGTPNYGGVTFELELPVGTSVNKPLP